MNFRSCFLSTNLFSESKDVMQLHCLLESMQELFNVDTACLPHRQLRLQTLLCKPLRRNTRHIRVVLEKICQPLQASELIE